MGPRIFTKVQIAAIAMAPAPMNRTSVEKILLTTPCSSSTPSTCPQVRMGSMTP